MNYEESKGSPSLLRLLAEGDGGRREAARAFVLHLALNHSVLLEESEGKVELSASSPDEQAFVAAAEHFGFEFVHRNQSKGVVGIRDSLAGVTHEVELLEVFDYESSRKRMSVVVRLPVELAAGGCREVLYQRGGLGAAAAARSGARRRDARGGGGDARRVGPAGAAHARLHAAAIASV